MMFTEAEIKEFPENIIMILAYYFGCALDINLALPVQGQGQCNCQVLYFSFATC